MTTNKIPAITPDYLTAQIVDVKYYRDTEFSPALTTCHLKMRNGFIVEGKSAVMDMARFNEDMGKDIAYKDAFAKLWQLEGYAMACAATNASVRVLSAAEIEEYLMPLPDYWGDTPTYALRARGLPSFIDGGLVGGLA